MFYGGAFLKQDCDCIEGCSHCCITLRLKAKANDREFTVTSDMLEIQDNSACFQLDACWVVDSSAD